jgi:hypothetical protein
MSELEKLVKSLMNTNRREGRTEFIGTFTRGEAKVCPHCGQDNGDCVECHYCHPLRSNRE